MAFGFLLMMKIMSTYQKRKTDLNLENLLNILTKQKISVIKNIKIKKGIYVVTKILLEIWK